jgi:hypothetical protein
MKFTEILNEGQLSEAKPRSKGADAFGQMARSVTGDKPNTMANTPASATNTPKPGNPNVPTFGKGTAMPTKPFQVPGAGTKPTPTAATSPAKPEVPPTEPTTNPSQSSEQPNTEPTPAADEKHGLMYKMGKGIGDFGRGFKIGYGGRMPTDADVVPDEEPASAGGTGDKSAAPVEKTTSDYARIKSNIDKLDNRSKRQLLTNLKKESLISLLSLLEEYNNDLTSNLERAFRNNPRGNLRDSLSSSLRIFAANLSEVIANTNQMVGKDNKFSLADGFYRQAIGNSLKHSFTLSQQITDRLDDLLIYRIQGFNQRKQFILIFVAVIFVAILYLFIGFYLFLR